MSENIFDDMDALRRAGAAAAAQDGPRKRKTAKGGREAMDGPFVLITKDEAAAGFQALDCRVAMVWLEIVYLAWKTKSTTVVLPSKELEALGVTKWMKGRALSKLEQAKLIRVVRFGQKSPRVTLLRRGGKR
jgi:hypothetical protein